MGFFTNLKQKIKTFFDDFSETYQPKGDTLEEKLAYAFNDTKGDSAFWWFINLPDKPIPSDKNFHFLHKKYMLTDFFKSSSSAGIEAGIKRRKEFVSLTLPNNIDYTTLYYYMDGKTIHRKCTSKSDYIDCIFEELEAIQSSVGSSWRRDFFSPFYTLGFWQVYYKNNSNNLQNEIFETFFKNSNSCYWYNPATNMFCLKPDRKDEANLKDVFDMIKTSVIFYNDEENAKELDAIIDNITSPNKTKKAIEKILGVINDLHYCPYSTTAKFLNEYKIMPENGICIFFDLSEKTVSDYRYNNESRIVYVGCNEQNENLSKRIKSHFEGTTNESILRKHISCCFPYNTDEEEISKYIKKNLFFQLVDIPEDSQKIKLESMLIATIAQNSEEFGYASPNWLGIKSNKFRNGRLWNLQQLNSQALDKNTLTLYQVGAITRDTIRNTNTSILSTKEQRVTRQTESTFLDSTIKEVQERKKVEQKEKIEEQKRKNKEFWANYSQMVEDDIKKQEEDRQKQYALQRCYNCANFDACGPCRGAINCGSFVAKKR